MRNNNKSNKKMETVQTYKLTKFVGGTQKRLTQTHEICGSNTK
jgi:hypothetical protein